jgi:hypothetical protein
MKILPSNGRILTHRNKNAHFRCGSEEMEQTLGKKPQSLLKVSTLSKKRNSKELANLSDLLLTTPENSHLAAVYRRIIGAMEDCPGQFSDLDALVQNLNDLLVKDSQCPLSTFTDGDLAKLINDLDDIWYTEALIQLQFALQAFEGICDSSQKPSFSDLCKYLKDK